MQCSLSMYLEPRQATHLEKNYHAHLYKGLVKTNDKFDIASVNR